jgi:hypothetical protein
VLLFSPGDGEEKAPINVATDGDVLVGVNTGERIRPTDGVVGTVGAVTGVVTLGDVITVGTGEVITGVVTVGEVITGVAEGVTTALVTGVVAVALVVLGVVVEAVAVALLLLDVAVGELAVALLVLGVPVDELAEALLLLWLPEPLADDDELEWLELLLELPPVVEGGCIMGLPGMKTFWGKLPGI